MATTTPTVWKALTKVNLTDGPGPFSNASATNEQSRSTALGLSGGGYVVAWEQWNSVFSGFEPRDISGLYFDVEGNVLGSEFLVSLQYQDLDQQAAALARAPNGGFYGAYQTTDAAGAGDLENVSIARFAENNPVYDRSDDLREGFNAPSVHNDTAPTITSFADGSYVVVFENDAAGNKDLTAYAISAAGVRTGPVTLVADAADEVTPKLATLSNQNFVLVYGRGGDLFFSIGTSALGAVASGTIAASAATETVPAVAALTGGGFVTVWQDSDADGAGNAGIRARVFNSAGVAAGASFVVPTTTTGVQDQPAVTALADGGFMVAWHDAARLAVYGQRYSAQGAKIGVEFTIAQLNDVSEPSLSLLADGRVLVTVTNDAGGNRDIYQVILDPRDSIINGTSGNDVITSRQDGATVNGLGGQDTLLGQGGADVLDGGTGADTLKGRGGNDVYILDDAGDIVIELAGGGTDRVESSTINLDLASYANVESVVLRGNLALAAQGTAGANTLSGEAAAGANTLTGLGGDDVYFVGAGDTIVEAAGGGTDRVQSSSISLDLANFANVENATLLGARVLSATGNAGNNTLSGDSNSAANVLTGLGGNDTYVLGAGDTIVEAAAGGTDTATSSTANVDISTFANVENISLTGALALSAKGNSGANVIYADANTAANVLTGLGGDDIYVVGAGDTIIEAANGGTADRVQSSLISLDLATYANVELAVLTGSLALSASGTAGNNTLSGESNSAANILTGRDGNDVYIVGAGDSVVETTTGGSADRVQSSTISIDLLNYANVEAATLTGALGLAALGSAAGNALTGNGAANRLDGRGGNDTLTGGAGADTFVFSTPLSAATNVDTIADFVAGDRIELAAGIFGAIGAAVDAGELRAGAGIVSAADANDFLIYNTTTGDLFYDADGNLNGAAAIKFATLSNKSALVATDFSIV